jgi:hypothetical protein
MDRIGIVREAFERFNDRDFEGALRAFDADVQVSDLLRTDEVMQGHDAVLQQWKSRFDEAHAEALVADVVEVGDTVHAAVCFQVYDQLGAAFGSPFMVASRFTFAEDRIVRLEQRAFNEVPDDVKSLFHLD